MRRDSLIAIRRSHQRAAPFAAGAPQPLPRAGRAATAFEINASVISSCGAFRPRRLRVRSGASGARVLHEVSQARGKADATPLADEPWLDACRPRPCAGQERRARRALRSAAAPCWPPGTGAYSDWPYIAPRAGFWCPHHLRPTRGLDRGRRHGRVTSSSARGMGGRRFRRAARRRGGAVRAGRRRRPRRVGRRHPREARRRRAAGRRRHRAAGARRGDRAAALVRRRAAAGAGPAVRRRPARARDRAGGGAARRADDHRGVARRVERGTRHGRTSSPPTRTPPACSARRGSSSRSPG